MNRPYFFDTQENYGLEETRKSYIFLLIISHAASYSFPNGHYYSMVGNTHKTTLDISPNINFIIIGIMIIF